MSWAEVDVIKKEIVNRSGVVKSVQRGITVTGEQMAVSIQISAVNMNKTFVNVQFQAVQVLNGEYRNQIRDCNVIGRLASSTELQVLFSSNDYRNGAVWEVIEFY